MVDDEELARRNVTVLLRGDPDIASIEECGSGVEAIAAIRRAKPDLWLTLSGWIWLGYAAGLLALLTAAAT